MRKLFGTDGIRAIAGQAPLDRPTIYAVGLALAHQLKAAHPVPRLILGQDTRESGDWIAETIALGLVAGGATLANAGVITTPAIAYLTRKYGFATGIVISASHNPWQDNGIKLFGSDGYKLPDALELAIEDEIFRLLAATAQADPALFTPALGDPANTALPPVDPIYRRDYESFLCAAVPSLFLEGLHAVIDCANGAASAIAPELFASLGGHIDLTHNTPDGRNINALCGALHPEIVASETAARKASIGITFDGDADRALFSDAHGRVVNGDAILLLAARALKSQGRLAADTVVATTMSNMGLEAALAKDGIHMLRAPVGDKYVLEMMQKHGASLGGEQSGHILFPHLATTGDGLLTALVVLDIVQRSGQSLEELLADLKVFPQVIVNIHVREKQPLEKFATITDTISAAERALAGRGRVVVRYSGTEALARVMIEAESEEEMRHHAERIANAIRSELGA